jgi:hypothetical protein
MGVESRAGTASKPIRKEKKMIRNLKVLGLALVAVFAMSAVAASAASAQNGIFTSDGPATLTGTNTEPTKPLENSLTAFGKPVTCPNALYTGHEVGSTTKGVPNGATEITLTPHYGVCAVEAFPATVDMNGCDYVLALRATTGIADQYNLHSTVKCPVGKHIVVTLFTNAAGHTASNPFCDITITENAAGYTGLKVKDTTNKTLDITGTIEGIAADKEIISGTTTDIGILCPKESTTTAVLHIDVSAVSGTTQIGLSHL